jgi:phosphoribosylamine-glycine ligase
LSADRKPKKTASIAEVKNGMERRRKTASEDGLKPQDREDLERIVVRLLEIAARCADPAVQQDLMKLADDLVKLIEA